jgi:hypothetical protein
VDFKEPTKLKAGFTVPADAPPMFIACASNDGQNPLASTVLYLELKKHNIPAELHLYAQGGHGFGMRANDQPINAWPARVQEWMSTLFPTAESQKLDVQIRDLKARMDEVLQVIKEYGAWSDDDPGYHLKQQIEALKKQGKEKELIVAKRRLEEFRKSEAENDRLYEAQLRKVAGSDVNAGNVIQLITKMKTELESLEKQKLEAEPGQSISFRLLNVSFELIPR